MVGGLQEVESVEGFSTSTQCPVWQTHRSPEDVFMTVLGVYFWYDTHEQLFRMENPWFTQEILTNGNTSLNWKIRVILINFNQYVCWGSCIFASCFLFFKNCTHAFTSLFNLMAYALCCTP